MIQDVFEVANDGYGDKDFLKLGAEEGIECILRDKCLQDGPFFIVPAWELSCDESLRAASVRQLLRDMRLLGLKRYAIRLDWTPVCGGESAGQAILFLAVHPQWHLRTEGEALCREAALSVSSVTGRRVALVANKGYVRAFIDASRVRDVVQREHFSAQSLERLLRNATGCDVRVTTVYIPDPHSMITAMALQSKGFHVGASFSLKR